MRKMERNDRERERKRAGISGFPMKKWRQGGRDGDVCGSNIWLYEIKQMCMNGRMNEWMNELYKKKHMN